MIKLQVIGNVGKDAVVNNVNGKNVINFSVCHTEKIKGSDGNMIDKSVWVDVAKWGETTGVAPYIKKGVKVFVEGKPEVHSYTRPDGTTGTSLKLTAFQIELLGGNSQAAGSTQANTAGAAPEATSGGSGDIVDDLPF